MSKKTISERLMFIFSFLVLATASAISILTDPSEFTILPYPEITVPILNTSCALFCFILIFIPENLICEIIILGVQCVSTTLTGYETLGTFLFMMILILLFINGFFKTHIRSKSVIILSLWLITILGVIPYGWSRFFLEIAVTGFFLGFSFYVYHRLKHLLSSFVPIKVSENRTIKLPQPGTRINLKNLGLNERQIKLIKEYLKTGNSYNQLAEKYYISTSTVKKDMTEAFSILGVRNLKEMHILLLQYDIE